LKSAANRWGQQRSSAGLGLNCFEPKAGGLAPPSSHKGAHREYRCYTGNANEFVAEVRRLLSSITSILFEEMGTCGPRKLLQAIGVVPVRDSVRTRFATYLRTGTTSQATCDSTAFRRNWTRETGPLSFAVLSRSRAGLSMSSARASLLCSDEDTPSLRALHFEIPGTKKIMVQTMELPLFHRPDESRAYKITCLELAHGWIGANERSSLTKKQFKMHGEHSTRLGICIASITEVDAVRHQRWL